MEDDLDAGDGAGDRGLVGDRALDQLRIRADVVAPTRRQVVEHANAVAPSEQRLDEVRTDEAGTAGDEYFHGISGV
jgi:hypothetical protein